MHGCQSCSRLLAKVIKSSLAEPRYEEERNYENADLNVNLSRLSEADAASEIFA